MGIPHSRIERWGTLEYYCLGPPRNLKEEIGHSLSSTTISLVGSRSRLIETYYSVSSPPHGHGGVWSALGKPIYQMQRRALSSTNGLGAAGKPSVLLLGSFISPLGFGLIFVDSSLILETLPSSEPTSELSWIGLLAGTLSALAAVGATRPGLRFLEKLQTFFVIQVHIPAPPFCFTS